MDIVQLCFCIQKEYIDIMFVLLRFAQVAHVPTIGSYFRGA